MSPSIERELAGAVDTATPIFVLRRSVNEFQHGALAVARSAGRLGIPVWSVASGPGEPAMRSRYVTGELALSPEAPESEWIEQLISLRPASGRAMLLPVDDLAAVLTGDHQDRLGAHFLLPAAPQGVQRRLASKRELWKLCGELELPTPASTFPVDESELTAQAATHGYPVVIKRAEPWLAPRDPGAPSVVIAHTRDQLLAAYARMESDLAPQVMLQQYIPGDSDSVWMFNGYAGAQSECLCAFTGRKLRQRGPRTGPTTLGVCGANPAVQDAARRLLRALDYRGIVDMGFRYDQRDGAYKLLDVNPRLGSTFRLFVAGNGIDVVRAMHLDLTGRPVPPSVTPSGRTWIDERSDLATSARLAREGALGARAWGRSLRGLDEAAWWAADDPLPFLAMAARSAPRAARVLGNGGGR
jgi:D-aspartate ligase